MKLIKGIFLLIPACAVAQITGPYILPVAVDPAGACSILANLQYNHVNGALWGCENGTWTQISGGGGGGVNSVTASAPLLSSGGANPNISTTLSNGSIWIGSAGNLPVAHTLSGDCTMTNAGVVTCTGTGGTIAVQADGTPVSGGPMTTFNSVSGTGIQLVPSCVAGVCGFQPVINSAVWAENSVLQSATNPQICTSASGSGSVYTASCAFTLGAYAAKQTLFWFSDFLSSTTTPSLNIDTLGAKTMVKNDGTALASGDIKANVEYRIWYDGTSIRVVEAGLGGGAGVVTSFTGDGSLISNSGSTGAVTATLATAAAHKFFGNNTGSTAAPGYQSIGLSDLPATVATTGTNTFTGQQTISLNGAASTPPSILTGTWFTGGSATTTKPQFLVEPTGTASTAWSTAGTGIGVNATSGFSGNLLDLQIAGVQELSILSTLSGTWIQAPSNNYLSIGNHTVFAAAPSLYLQGTGRIDVVSAGAGVHIQGAVLTAESGFISLPTASDPGCTGAGDIGRQWMDSTSAVTTHFKVCANVASSPAWVQVF